VIPGLDVRGERLPENPTWELCQFWYRLAHPGNFRRQWRRCWWKKQPPEGAGREEAENSLMVEKMEVEGVSWKAKTIFNVGGRNKKHLKVAYNNEQLQVLP
jgi:hypothetical protein